MSETPRIYDITGQKELEGDFVEVDIEKKDFSTSLKILSNAETLVEFSPLERWNDNIAANGDLCGQTTATTGTSLVAYRLYKRRWVGLIQLVLLNMLFGWNVCCYPLLKCDITDNIHSGRYLSLSPLWLRRTSRFLKWLYMP
jgi:hypothetical protein